VVSKSPRAVHGKSITSWVEKRDKAELARDTGENVVILTFGVNPEELVGSKFPKNKKR
jgi:hypothetical protein